jgi:hypothetical protein
MRFENAYDVLIRPFAISHASDAGRLRFDRVDGFVDFLASLSVDEWLAIGDRAVGQSVFVSEALLNATVVEHRLCFDAWLAHDAIETIVFLASCSLPRGSCRSRRAIEHARVAAERAALAVLACEWLARSDIDELMSPFS